MCIYINIIENNLYTIIICNMFGSFELSEWQKKSVISIETGNHCLVTAPTGSGKTVPAEYAIHYFNNKGRENKKVIYTSPIKALSNQKYYEFQKKFPDISFGILTGDIKDNPEADVLIMTTEILCNHLHNMQHSTNKLEFNIDIEHELGCVIFDEVHYINDADRGTVWEECFMLLPKHVQLVMLSATIATPETFAGWIESIHPASDKKVVICDTTIRSVPLSHYMWLTATDSSLLSKKVMTKMCNAPVLLYNEEDGFQEQNYQNMYDTKPHLTVKRQHVMNHVVDYLHANDMLPGICFVYSRKNVERIAKELTGQYIDSVKMNHVEKECRHVLSTFPNAKEYMALPEYKMVVSLLEKGIGIHHSGLLPVFREMTELLFDKGYIKMLFATETFAVGLNMPTKTVLFTSLQKFDGSKHRYLLPHEYTQQSGRAGRRGYDTVGHVIHLSNLFDIPPISEYKIMLGNIPQRIVSKLKISYSMLLNYSEPEEFINRSAIQHQIKKESGHIQTAIVNITQYVSDLEIHLTEHVKTSSKILSDILELENTLCFYKNKQQKIKQGELRNLYLNNPFAKEELHYMVNLIAAKKEQDELTTSLDSTQNYTLYQIQSIREILKFNHFIGSSSYNISRMETARTIKETHPLMMTDVFEKFDSCKPIDIIALFSCFTNVNVNNEIKNTIPKCDLSVKGLQLMELAQEKLTHYYNEEIRTDIYSGACYDIHYDLADECIKWCKCETEEECITFLTTLQREKGVFLGEFTKAILKINAISKEMERVCEIQGFTNILYTLSLIGDLTLKSVCTSQSLYV